MEFEKIIDERYSVRSYEARQIEPEKLKAIIAAGMKAPTGKNHQPQRILAVQSAEAMEKLKAVCKCTFGAPTCFVVCYNRDEAWHSRFEEGYTCGEMDVSIVTSYMMLKAQELGLGTCWVRYFDSREVAKAFDLPENIIPACVLDVGYPSPEAKPLETMHNRPRPVDEVFTIL